MRTPIRDQLGLNDPEFQSSEGYPPRDALT